MLVTISAIAILLVLSAFFSGTETALTAASQPLMHQLGLKGNHRAQALNRMFESKERFLGAILLGNNAVNILGSALAASLFISLFGNAGVIYATLAMTLLVVVFGEIVPKTYAFKNANRAALAVAPVIGALVTVLAPVTHALQIVVRGVFKVFGVDFHADEAFAHGSEELRGAIELHATDPDAIKQERAMLHSVLDLAEVQVGEIMVHRKNMVRIDAGARPEKVLDQVLASPFTRIPLWRDEPDNIVGVLHAKELLRAMRGQDKNLKDLDVVGLAAKPWFVPDTTPLLDQLQAFRERRAHFALVVDEYGSILGLVTLEDILEEIVGEISDEHDVTVTGVRQHPDGSFSVQGQVTIRDLNREFEWRLPDEEAATVAGLVLHEARRIPEVGQVFMFHGFRFEILRRQRHQITSVRITPPAKSAQDR
ncbi:MAG: HlyC/CorC family transporter [Rhodospirillales bacterium]|jgi:Mg2+/Co2+ transporter CorB|nr:HlyC/CorC family transporter [Rhodospirillales bacterium]MDP6883555.1 HlyC/CorC family transporter [Rhodospirillales bacterium]